MIDKKDQIITDPDCDHDWNVHNDIGMDMVYCHKCNSVQRDRALAMDIFIKMCDNIDKNQ